MAALFGFPMLMVGLVLLLAGGSWFPGATTVGLILVAVSGVALILAVLILVCVAIIASKATAPGSVRTRSFR